MTLPAPRLDERTFDDLVDEALSRARQSCPEWSDLGPGDPGRVLIELFAHLTDTMLARLNRLPELAYVEFLRLIGVRLQPPAAALVALRFSLARPADSAVEIRRGTRVSADRQEGAAEPPVFATIRGAVIAPGERSVEVHARHAELVAGELIGHGSGAPGLSLSVTRPPIIAATGDHLDLVVGVEAGDEDARAGAAHTRALLHDGKRFEVWREVESFADCEPSDRVYLVDRLEGRVTFATGARWRVDADGLGDRPRTLAAVPPAGREIRAWYQTGGGPSGNVAANTLTVLKDPLAGMQVTNPEPAAGGRAAESLDNALVRGPQELHSLQRAVTARDFETLAMRSSGGVDRAKAVTEAAVWSHARPGSVEVLLVPHVPEEARPGGRIDFASVLAHRSEAVRAQIQQALDERRPLGTLCRARWAHCKPVAVEAVVVVRREEDADAVKQRLLERLHRLLSPVPSPPDHPGWQFGETLRDWHIYEILRSEPGIGYVERIGFRVEPAPEAEVVSLAADPFQPRTWFAAAGDRLYRSVNDGQGWETVLSVENEALTFVRTVADDGGGSVAGRSRSAGAGLVVVATSLGAPGSGTRLRVSRDCGESWRTVARTTFEVADAAWLVRQNEPVLLLASAVGLYELSLRPGSVPVQALVDAAEPGLGFAAVAAATTGAGAAIVAVAAANGRGIWLSLDGGRGETFTETGMKNRAIGCLGIQQVGPHSYLWAGVTAPHPDAGAAGCFRRRLSQAAADSGGDGDEEWAACTRNWQGGDCLALSFQGPSVLAATASAGVVWLDGDARDAAWQAPGIGCGLPLRTEGGLQPVVAAAAGDGGRVILAAGDGGIYRSAGPTGPYAHTSRASFPDRVPLPESWLLCSGEHKIEIVTEHEAQRD